MKEIKYSMLCVTSVYIRDITNVIFVILHLNVGLPSVCSSCSREVFFFFFLMCVDLWQCLIILRWPCAIDWTLKSNYWVTNSSVHALVVKIKWFHWFCVIYFIVTTKNGVVWWVWTMIALTLRTWSLGIFGCIFWREKTTTHTQKMNNCNIINFISWHN